MTFFKVAKNIDEAAENWLIGFGADDDGNQWYLTTNHVHASEFYLVSNGAKLDAELVCKLLNDYYGDKYEKHLGPTTHQKSDGAYHDRRGSD